MLSWSALAYGAATFLAYQLCTAIYVGCGAALAAYFEVEVREVSIGFGPAVFRRRFGTWQLKLGLFPIGGYTNMRGEGDDFEDDFAEEVDTLASEALPDHQRGLRYWDVSGWAQLAIQLSGPFSSLGVGVVLLALPALCGTPALVVTTPEASQIRPCAVRGLAVHDEPTTAESQARLVLDIPIEYTWRLFAFQSLDGWGGGVGCVVTCGLVGQLFDWAWVSCIGLVFVWNGLANLIPLPTLNGFHICHAIHKALSGRRIPERVLMPLIYVGLLVNIAVFIRFLYIDARWLYQSFLA